MTAKTQRFILRPYVERKTKQEAERARYLRAPQTKTCRTCYGLARCQPCAKCGEKDGSK